MAGSLGHVLNDDGSYRGVDLLENMGDMHEAVEEMAFIILWIDKQVGHTIMGGISKQASDEYFKCLRGEQPWPEWFEGREQ